MTPSTTPLEALRALMLKHGIQAYFIPSEDAHQSEYIAPWDGRRAFISKFTGSAGFACVTLEKAALWTDGRYFLQASQQLDPKHWILMKSGLPDVPSMESWLKSTLAKGSKLGIDPKLVTFDASVHMKKELDKVIEIKLIQDNLIDQIWTNRPTPVFNVVKSHDVKFAGVEASEKISKIQDVIRAKSGAAGLIASALDDIAWLFNLRGSDVPMNPVFFSHAIVTPDSVHLYLHQDKVSAEVRSHIPANVHIKDYAAIFSDLSTIFAPRLRSSQEKFIIGSSCNVALAEALGGAEFVMPISPFPIQIAKAIKNSVEIEGFRQSHIRDAVALCSFFTWLEAEMTAGKVYDEVQVSDVLEGYRRKQDHFQGLSFDTISGSGPNGAIIHYHAMKESCRKLSVNEMYLCDSGGQYSDGTTDVTRTLHFGTPTPYEKECFTRVLKGHIGIDSLVIPAGTTGYSIDCVARLALWKVGLNYRHGTGHGVGSFLNVHEGPQGIGPRPGYNQNALQAGMTVTNEPGFYEDGKFGIRIENVLITKEATSLPYVFGDGKFLCFESFTLVPICKKLIVRDLLTEEEVAWLNKYHETVWNVLSKRIRENPFPPEDSKVLEWLKKETSPL